MKETTANLILTATTDSALLSAIADICGKSILVHREDTNNDSCDANAASSVVCGESYCIVAQDIYNKTVYDVSYDLRDNKSVCRVYVGHRTAGPMFMRDGRGWQNLYSHGNFGKNATCGGNWSAKPLIYPTLAECYSSRGKDCDEISLRYCVMSPVSPLK